MKVPVATAEFSGIEKITPELLAEYGIKGILTDLDDTLVPHGYPEPDERACKWLKTMADAGIPVCIISNNSRKRTSLFAAKAGVGFFSRAYKPARRCIDLALAVINTPPDNAVLIGDQLFTDIAAARNAGIKSFLVTPVGNRTTAFIRFKRKIEARFAARG